MSVFPNWEFAHENICPFPNFLFSLLVQMYFAEALVVGIFLLERAMALIHPIEIRGKHFYDSVIDKPVRFKVVIENSETNTIHSFS